MRRRDPIRWALVASIAAPLGCQCQGKTAPVPAARSKPAPGAETSGPEGPAKVRRKAPPTKGRFDVVREGFAKATLGQRRVELSRLPPEKNRVVFAAKPAAVIVDAFGAAGSTEHLRIHLQGILFEESSGRPLMPRRDRPHFVVSLLYEDADGKAWTGKAGGNGRLKIELDDVDTKAERVSGRFSGVLDARDGDAELTVTDGVFKTARGARD